MENGWQPLTHSLYFSHNKSSATISRIRSASDESLADESNCEQKYETTSNNDIKREEQSQHHFDELATRPATFPRKTKKADCTDLHRINTTDDTQILQRNSLSSSQKINRKNVSSALKDSGYASSTLVAGDNNITTTLPSGRGNFIITLINAKGNISITQESEDEEETLLNNDYEGKAMLTNTSEKKAESNVESESKTMFNSSSRNVSTIQQNCDDDIVCISPKNDQAEINLTQKNDCRDMNMTQCHINGYDNTQDIDSKIKTEFTFSNYNDGSDYSAQSKSNADVSTSSEKKAENVYFNIETESKICKGIDDTKSTSKSNNYNEKFRTLLNNEKQNFEVLHKVTTGIANLSDESCKVEAKINNNANKTVSELSGNIKDISSLVHKPNDGDFQRQLRIDDEENSGSLCRKSCGNKDCIITKNGRTRNDLTLFEGNLDTSCESIDATQIHVKRIVQGTDRFCTEGGNEFSSNKTDDRPALVISGAKYVQATPDSETDTDLKGAMACDS